MLAAYFSIHIVLPLVMFLWILWRKPYGHADFTLQFLSAAGLTAFLFYWGQYAFVGSHYIRYILPLALAATLILHYVRSKKHTLAWQMPAGWRQWLMFGLFGVLTVLFGLGGIMAFQGTGSPDGRTVSMEMPLKQGTYYVSVGGSNGLLNMHYKMRGSGQYAVDFNRLGGWGRVAGTLFSEDNQDHYIYSDTVFSPCAGIVEETYDEVPERTVTLDMRDVPRGGNILTLQSDDIFVSLTHVQHGSIMVAVGDTVVVGQPLALVGNNGYSTEPHLHMQVFARENSGEDKKSIGIPMLFGDRFLVRNDLIVSLPQGDL
jgi:hypothetical protein